MRRLVYKGRWAIGVVLLVGASVFAYLQVRDAWRAAQKNDIYATAVRHWSEHKAPRSLGRRPVYISVDGKDPDEQLMRYLRGSIPAFRKASEWTNPPGTGVGIGVCNLTWVGCSAATVSVVDTYTWNFVAGEHYRVLRRGGRWEVSSVGHFGYEVLRDSWPRPHPPR